jgi:mevalonate pyrophosphate decarboxylase
LPLEGEKSLKRFKNDAEDEIQQIKETIHFRDFQKMIHVAEMDLEEIQEKNYETLKNLYNSV